MNGNGSTTVNVNRVSDFTEDVPAVQAEGMMQVATARAAQEVQAAMVIAKKFPRDETAAFARVMKACKRKALAEQALYAYPRGGETVEGPSIRMAETLAKAWGNIDFGMIELEQKKGESTMMAYAWDLETNTRQTKVFQVAHVRHTRQGQKELKDPRDIYELTANQGARRLRACILGIIPGDVVEAAVAECEKTMAGNNTEPLTDRIRAMVAAFGDLSVTQEMIEHRLNHKIEVTTETELVQLKKIYRSLRDGMAGRDQFFPTAPPDNTASSRTQELNERLAAAQQSKPAQEQTKEDPEVDDVQTESPEVENAWDKFYETHWQAAEAINPDKAHFDKAMEAALLKVRKKGMPEKTTADDRKKIGDEFKAKSGPWAYLKGAE